MKSGVCTCEDGYEVEEKECRLQYTLTAYELATLRITFKNSLSSSLTSADLTLTTNSTDLSALLTTEITLAAYILNLEFTTTQESPVSVEVVVNKTDQSKRTVSQAPHSAVLQFSKANSTSDLTDKTTQEVTSSVSSYATAAIGGAAMITGSPSMMMSMLNTVQFISYLPLMNLDIEPQLRALLIGSNPFANLPNYALKVIDPDDFEVPFPRAEDYGFETSGFVVNIGKNILVLVSLLASHLVVAGLSRCCCVSVRLYFRKMLQCYHLDNYVLFILASFIELHVQASVQLRSPSGVLVVLASYSLAVGLFFFLTLLPFCIACAVPVAKADSRGRMYRLFEVLFVDLKRADFGRYFYPVSLLHQYLCLSVILFTDSPLAQILVCSVLTILVSSRQKLLYLLTARPFKDSMLLISICLGDLCILVSIIAVSVEYFLDAKFTPLRYAVMVSQLSVAGFNIVLSTKNAVQTLRRRSSSKIVSL
jgi:hypothetical protein